MKKKLAATLLTCMALTVCTSSFATNWIDIGKGESDGTTITFSLDTDSIEYGKNKESLKYDIKNSTKISEDKYKGKESDSTLKELDVEMTYEENTVDNLWRVSSYEIMQNGVVTSKSDEPSAWQPIENFDKYEALHHIISFVETVEPIGGRLESKPADIKIDLPKDSWKDTFLEGLQIDMKTVKYDKASNRMVFWTRYNDKGATAWVADFNEELIAPFAVYTGKNPENTKVEDWLMWLPITNDKVIKNEAVATISVLGELVVVALADLENGKYPVLEKYYEKFQAE